MEICAEVEPAAFLSPSGLTSKCHLHTSGPTLQGTPISDAPLTELTCGSAAGRTRRGCRSEWTGTLDRSVLNDASSASSP